MRAFFYFISSLFLMKFVYKNIWNLKESYQKKPSVLKYKLYYWQFDSAYKGSWIGINSIIKSIPKFPHGINGIFISDKAVIGHNVVIFHQVTIGSNTISGSKTLGSPEIGDEVYIGCGAKIIGKVQIGNNSRIGANAVVVSDIPENSTVVCPKPRIIIKPEKMRNIFTSIDKI